MTEKIEDIVALQVEAIKNIKIDKVTVWDSGSGADGKGGTANFLYVTLEHLSGKSRARMDLRQLATRITYRDDPALGEGFDGRLEVFLHNGARECHDVDALVTDGSAIIYSSSAPAKDGSVYVTRLDGSGTKEIKTGLNAVGDATMVTAAGRTFLSFTALPTSGSDWRQLHIIDVTGQI